MLDVGKHVTEQSIMKIETLFKELHRHVEKGCTSLENKVDDVRATVAAKPALARGTNQPTSSSSTSSGMRPAAGLEHASATAIAALVEQQKKNSDGLVKLHASVEALLRSQEALRPQHVFNNTRRARLEANLAGLEERNSQAFSTLQQSVEVLAREMNARSQPCRAANPPGTTAAPVAPTPNGRSQGAPAEAQAKQATAPQPPRLQGPALTPAEAPRSNSVIGSAV